MDEIRARKKGVYNLSCQKQDKMLLRHGRLDAFCMAA
jgi:hypothetical protein